MKKPLSEAARAARAAYKRKWQRENRERVREYEARYWAKVAERAKAEKAERAEAEAR